MLPALHPPSSIPATARLPQRLVSLAAWGIAAVGLAGAHAAHAAIASTTSTPDALSPELSLTIWDPVGKASYALDLGMTMDDLLVQGQADAGLQKFWIIDKTTDVPFSKLRELGTSVGSLEWMVFAADTDGFGDPGDFRVATTLRPTSASGVMGADYLKLTSLANIDYNNLNAVYENYVAALNVGANNAYNLHGDRGPGGSTANADYNGSSFAIEGQDDYVLKYSPTTMGTLDIRVTNAIGSSSWFYALQASSYETQDAVLVDEFDNLSYDAYWGLAENPADGTFVLSYTMRSALPTASQLAFARAIGRTEYSGGFMSHALAGAAAAAIDDRAHAAGFSRPLGAAVSPVPEPSTWLLLAGGLAAVGLAARRRNRRG